MCKVQTLWYFLNMTQTLSIKDTRNRLAEIINQVAISGDEFVITKFGQPKAMIVPISTSKAKSQKSVLEETFGAWKHRSDIKDSGKWVRELRAKLSVRR